MHTSHARNDNRLPATGRFTGVAWWLSITVANISTTLCEVADRGLRLSRTTSSGFPLECLNALRSWGPRIALQTAPCLCRAVHAGHVLGGYRTPLAALPALSANISADPLHFFKIGPLEQLRVAPEDCAQDHRSPRYRSAGPRQHASLLSIGLLHVARRQRRAPLPATVGTDRWW